MMNGLLRRSFPAAAAALCAMVLSLPGFAQDDAAAIFKARCVICHGADGAGKTEAAKKMPMPDLRSAEVQKLTDAELFESIALGKGHKSYPHTYRYKGLSDPQIQSLVRYLRELAKKKP